MIHTNSVGLLWTRDRPFAENKHHSKETDIHVLNGNGTRNPRNAEEADVRLYLAATGVGSIWEMASLKLGS